MTATKKKAAAQELFDAQAVDATTRKKLADALGLKPYDGGLFSGVQSGDVRIYLMQKYSFYPVEVVVDPNYRGYGHRHDARLRKRKFKCPVSVAKLKEHIATMQKLYDEAESTGKAVQNAREKRERDRRAVEEGLHEKFSRLGAEFCALFIVPGPEYVNVEVPYLTPAEAAEVGELLGPWFAKREIAKARARLAANRAAEAADVSARNAR